MSKRMIKSSMVYPSKDTPKRSIWLSDIDLIKRTPFTHTPLVYVYTNQNNINIINNNNNNNNNNNSISFKYFDSTRLISSLSEALVTFYPLAGRLRENKKSGRIEIDCNAEGVLFVEVETSHNISDFGDFTPDQKLRQLVIPTCDYSGGLAKIPLFMVQLTRFRCGGVCLGFGTHHFPGDGIAFAYFINQWARLARGLDIAVLPVFDRTSFLAPRKPPHVDFDHPEFQRRPSEQLSSGPQEMEETTVGLFKFTRDQISALKKQAMSPKSDNIEYSTFEVLSAHVWRCALKARGVLNNKVVKFSTPISGRSKFNHPIVPEGIFCNFIFNSVYFEKASDVLSRPLWYAASKVRETVKTVDEGYMKSAVDFLSLQPDVTVFATGPHTSSCPDIHVNFWKGLPSYEADFGWGKPQFVRHGGIGYEGQVFIMPDESGNDLFLAINLFVSHMDRFKKIIYDFEERRASL